MYVNDYDFLSKKISKLELEIRNKIYIKLISFCKDEKHKKMKEYIKDYYINGLNHENLDEFIIFIESLEYDDNIDVMDRINNKYQITPDDFYGEKECKNQNKEKKEKKDIKILLLYKLNNKNLIKEENNKYFENSTAILKGIYEEIGNKTIKISQLKSLFACKEEDYIKNKLELFNMLKDENVDVEELFEKLKNDYDEIINKLEDLNYISSNLEKYYSKFYEKQINEIKSIVETIDSGTYEDYENKKTSLSSLLDKKEEADKINKVKTLNLFGILYRNTKGSNQDEHFKNALNKLDNISIILKSEDPENKKILDEVKKNNIQINKEIKDYFTQKNSDNELSLLVNFDSYERDIQSIFYFFDNFHNDENWNKILSPKYKDISKENMQLYLKELKEKKIYDYEYESKSQKSFYIKLFNCLYKKQEAFDFLNRKHENINLLYEKLDPNIKTLTAKDIDDTIACVEFFKEIKKKRKK